MHIILIQASIQYARAGMRILGTQPSAGACPQRSTSAYATATPRAPLQQPPAAGTSPHMPRSGQPGGQLATLPHLLSLHALQTGAVPRAALEAGLKPALSLSLPSPAALAATLSTEVEQRCFSAQAARRKPARSTSSGGRGGWSRGSARAVAPPRNARRQSSWSLLARACEPTSSSLRLAAQHARALWIGFSERTTHEKGRYCIGELGRLSLQNGKRNGQSTAIHR